MGFKNLMKAGGGIGMGNTCKSMVAQLVKNLPAMRKT